MITIIAFMYVCATYFLTGENNASWVLAAMVVDAVALYYLSRE